MTPDPASLDRLRDIVTPTPIASWPPAAGVWWLGVALLPWIAYGVVAVRRRRRRNAYRRAALAEIARLRPRLAEAGERPAAVRELAAVLKRTALVAYPRRSVASLSGHAWVGFLDRTIAGGFDPASARILTDVDARPGRAVDAPAARDLADAAAHWIARHRRWESDDPTRSAPGGRDAAIRA